MEARRWVNTTQPQTLQIAVLLLYLNAALGLLGLLGGAALGAIGLLILVANVAAGHGIANERRWGYVTGLAVALLPFVVLVVYGGQLGLVALVFDVALVALLLHPQSREYQRIWFK